MADTNHNNSELKRQPPPHAKVHLDTISSSVPCYIDDLFKSDVPNND